MTTNDSVLAFGAWLKNAACRLDGTHATWSPLHGDLDDPAACRALDDSVRRLAHDTPRPLAAVAHDLHPDFFSTRLAQELADTWQVPAIAVQHHHAHIAAVMAEHRLEEPVVGLALDGIGLGTDGTAWGGELLWVAPGAWRRLGALAPLRLPGGDAAAREPWRMAAAALHAAGRGAEIEPRFGPTAGPAAARGIARLLDTGLNCPLTTSTGRWFDAAAAALGLSVRQAHEAEAAIALERAATLALERGPLARAPLAVTGPSTERLAIDELLRALFDDPFPDPQTAAAWFHLSLAHSLADWAAHAARATGARGVALGGGCFFNRVLTRAVVDRLEQHGLHAWRPIATNPGDAGLALGQAWVAQRDASTTP